MNQSLRCALGRWLGEVPPTIAARVPAGVSPGLGLPVIAVAWITRLLSLLLLGLVLLTAWRVRERDGPARTWVFGAALALSVLLSPLSWKAHHVALVPLLLLMVRRAVDERWRPAIWLLLLFVPCCALGGDLLGDDNAEWINSLYVVTAFDAALLAVALTAACSDRQPLRG